MKKSTLADLAERIAELENRLIDAETQIDELEQITVMVWETRPEARLPNPEEFNAGLLATTTPSRMQ